MSKTKPDITVTIKDEWEMRESVIRTSAGSKNMAEMRVRKEKPAISPQRIDGIVRSTFMKLRESSFVGKYENITRGVII